MKKLITVLLCALTVLSLTACQKEETNAANPFVECKDVAEASELAGFDVTLPESLPDWAGDPVIRVIEDELVELVYTDGAEEDLRFRKAPGSDDISGDLNQYEQTVEVNLDNIIATLKGKNNWFHVATWTKGDYTYSITSEKAADPSLLIYQIVSFE